MLILLLACTSPDDPQGPKPGRDDTAADSGDTDPGDTDTGDTDPGDTDSGDTDSGDTDTDSGDTDTDDTALVDADGDGHAADVDCDDADPDVHPGATDVCNGADDDCDGTYEEDATTAEAWRGGRAYPTLQLALDGAAVGDTVSLCPGTYTGPFAPAGPVTIEGWARDPARTILDGGGSGPIVALSDFVDRPDPLRLTGVTLRNGVTTDRGGAVFATAVNVETDNVVFEDNTARVGGAIATSTVESIRLENTVFRRNTATDAGGAVYLAGASTDTVSLQTTGSTFQANTAAEEGGALAADLLGYGELYVQYATFSDNVAGTSGGALAVAAARTVRVYAGGATFSGNSAAAVGAIWVRSDTTAELELQNGTFTDNRAATLAGAVYVDAPSAMVNSIYTAFVLRNLADDGSCAAVAGYGELEGDWGEGADDNAGCDLSLSVCAQVRDDLGADTDVQCRSDGSWTEG